MKKEKDPHEALLLMAQCKYFYHEVARDQDCLEYFEEILYKNFEFMSGFFEKLNLFYVFDKNGKEVDVEVYRNLGICDLRIYKESSIVVVFTSVGDFVGFISLFYDLDKKDNLKILMDNL
jgi:hypothetical protein